MGSAHSVAGGLPTGAWPKIDLYMQPESSIDVERARSPQQPASSSAGSRAFSSQPPPGGSGGDGDGEYELRAFSSPLHDVAGGSRGDGDGDGDGDGEFDLAAQVASLLVPVCATMAVDAVERSMDEKLPEILPYVLDADLLSIATLHRTRRVARVWKSQAACVTTST